MNKVILAYCRENVDLAMDVDQHLSRIGIQFEHITNRPGTVPGEFAAWVQSTDAPVLLFITDNFLKSQGCMASALTMLQHLIRNRRALPIVADGIWPAEDGHGVTTVPTLYDRVIHAIQYMNYWQSAYLELRSEKKSQTETSPEIFEERMNVVRDISNEIGEFLNLLKENEVIAWPEFKNDHFYYFFKKFNILEWHEQYEKLADIAIPEHTPVQALPVNPVAPPQILENGVHPEASQNGFHATDTDYRALEAELEVPPIEPVTAVPTPETPQDDILHSPETFAQIDSIIEDILREEAEETPITLGAELPTEPEPVEENQAQPEQPPVIAAPVFEAVMPTPVEIPAPTPLPESPTEDAIDATINDAIFWFEKNQPEQGIELLRYAMEKYPESEKLRAHFTLAKVKKSGNTAETAAIFESYAASVGFDPHAFETLGDQALLLGDPHFAALCWEKAASFDPDLPGIFLKLGRLTDEYFKGSKKKAAKFYKAAAHQQPNDIESSYRYATILFEHLDKPKKAAKYFLNVLALQPDHPSAWFELAQSYLRLGDAVKAEYCYLKAVEINSEYKNEVNDRLLISSKKPAEKVVETPKDGLTIIVTGATSGIGLSTARLLAAQGHRLILLGRRLERLDALKTELELDFQSEIYPINVDIRSFEKTKAAFDALPDVWANIDVLINNAGLAKGFSAIHEGDLDHWETMIDTNIKGLLYMTKIIAPGMVARRKGHIINIGSIAGKEAYPKGNVYCATKSAVDALTKAVRMDLYPYHIRVSQISPGHVEDTEFALNRFDGDAQKARIYDDFQPLKASDIAQAVFYVISQPPHVNIQDIVLYGTQQASATMIDRSGR